MNDNQFNFVIARYWPKSTLNPYSNRLRCYAYGTEVHYGNEEVASDMAKNISIKTGEEYRYFRIQEKNTYEHEASNCNAKV